MNVKNHWQLQSGVKRSISLQTCLQSRHIFCKSARCRGHFCKHLLRIARITQPIFVVVGLSCDDAQCSQRRRTPACCEIGFVPSIWELMGRRAFPLASAYVSLRNHSPGQIGCEDAHAYVASPKAAKHRVRATVGWCFEGGELLGELVLFSNCSPWRNKLGCRRKPGPEERGEKIHSLQPSEFAAGCLQVRPHGTQRGAHQKYQAWKRHRWESRHGWRTHTPERLERAFANKRDMRGMPRH